MSEEIVKNDANVVYGVLCYIGILVLVPFLAEKNKDEYLKCHIRQGLGILVLYIICSIIGNILNTGILVLLVFILALLGIINAVKKKVAGVPLIGGYFDKIFDSFVK